MKDCINGIQCSSRRGTQNSVGNRRLQDERPSFQRCMGLRANRGDGLDGDSN